MGARAAPCSGAAGGNGGGADHVAAGFECVAQRADGIGGALDFWPGGCVPGRAGRDGRGAFRAKVCGGVVPEHQQELGRVCTEQPGGVVSVLRLFVALS